MSLTELEIDGARHRSYATVGEADRILAVDPRRRAAWAAAGKADKAVLLIAATNRLDLLSWRGGAAPDDPVPEPIERATALLAGSIAGNPKMADAGKSARAVRRVRAGPAEIEFGDRSEARRPIQDETVFELVRDWLESSSAVGVGAAHGTDQRSRLADYDRSGGLS